MKSFFYFQSITAVRNQNVGKTLKHDFWITLVGKRIMYLKSIYFIKTKNPPLNWTLIVVKKVQVI